MSCGTSDDFTENPLENLCLSTNLDETVECLKKQPKEDILAIPQVATYLGKHKVYISFTTSPERIHNAIWMLKTLDLENVDEILLALPALYKNKHPYGIIPSEIINFPKLKVIAQDREDIGPATKILYALAEVAKTDPDAIVISLDDDTGLPFGGVGQLIKHAVLYPDAVVGGAGRYIGLYGIQHHEWLADSMTEKAPYCSHGELSYCHVLEGYKGIAYKPRLVDVDRAIDLAKASKHCLTSDDLVISYHLAERKIERIRIANPFYYKVGQFGFGFQGDALHNIKSDYPDGWAPRSSWAGLVGVGNTAERYQRCVYDLNVKHKSKS